MRSHLGSLSSTKAPTNSTNTTKAGAAHARAPIREQQQKVIEADLHIAVQVRGADRTRTRDVGRDRDGVAGLEHHDPRRRNKNGPLGT